MISEQMAFWIFGMGVLIGGLLVETWRPVRAAPPERPSVPVVSGWRRLVGHRGLDPIGDPSNPVGLLGEIDGVSVRLRDRGEAGVRIEIGPVDSRWDLRLRASSRADEATPLSGVPLFDRAYEAASEQAFHAAALDGSVRQALSELPRAVRVSGGQIVDDAGSVWRRGSFSPSVVSALVRLAKMLHQGPDDVPEALADVAEHDPVRERRACAAEWFLLEFPQHARREAVVEAGRAAARGASRLRLAQLAADDDSLEALAMDPGARADHRLWALRAWRARADDAVLAPQLASLLADGDRQPIEVLRVVAQTLSKMDGRIARPALEGLWAQAAEAPYARQHWYHLPEGVDVVVGSMMALGGPSDFAQYAAMVPRASPETRRALLVRLGEDAGVDVVAPMLKAARFLSSADRRAVEAAAARIQARVGEEAAGMLSIAATEGGEITLTHGSAGDLALVEEASGGPPDVGA